MRQATAQQILELLRDHADELLEKVGARPVHLSFPTDGRGARLKVSVCPGCATDLPCSIQVRLGGSDLEVPIEVAEDYEQIRPQA